MVYYQSMTPLILKSGHSSQYTRLCASSQEENQQQGQQHYFQSQLLSQQQQQQQQQQAALINFKPVTVNKHNQRRNLKSAEDPLPCSIIQQDPKSCSVVKTMSSFHLLDGNIERNPTASGNMERSLCSQSSKNALLSSSPSASPSPSASVTASSLSPSPSLTLLSPSSATSTVGHKTSFASKLQFKCDKCNMIFGSRSAHTSHIKSHMRQINSGTTNNSNMNLNTTTNLQLDVIQIKQSNIAPNLNAMSNGSDPHQCNVCQKSFAVPARLIRHYRTHTGERPFECEFCHKLFSVKENLQVHRRIHTKERPYKCDVCGRAFEHSGKLHRHMRIHTGERPHKCSVCEKTFIQSGQLVIHMRTHTGEKPYKCPVEGCGKGFTCSKQLKVHSRTHTGEKPYHCDICFRDFGYNHVLKLHRVQHYGSKCYKCTICEETFKNKKEMETHIKGHANELTDEEATTAPSTNTTIMTNLVSSSSISSTSSGIESNSSPNSSPSPSASLTSTLIPIANNNSIKEVPTNVESRPFRSLSSSSSSFSDSPNKESTSVSSMCANGFAYKYETISPTASYNATNLPSAVLKAEGEHPSYDGNISSNCVTLSGIQKREIVTTTSDSEKNTTTCATLENLHSQNYYINTKVSSEEMPTDLSTAAATSDTTSAVVSTVTTTGSGTNSMASLHNTTLNNCHVYSPHTILTSKPQQSLQQQVNYNHTMYTSDKQSQKTIETILLNSTTSTNPNIDTRVAMANYSNPISNNPTLVEAVTAISSNCIEELKDPLKKVVDTNYDSSIIDTNVWMEHYKDRNITDITRQSLSKGFAPIPKFESSMQNNDILRQVEAAIAPLHTTTDSLSQEETLSPESAKLILMADRDMMTLPLRKRKLYMNDSARNVSTYDDNHMPSVAKATSSNLLPNATITSKYDDISDIIKDANQKVRRHNSVIQFAKAST